MIEPDQLTDAERKLWANVLLQAQTDLSGRDPIARSARLGSAVCDKTAHDWVNESSLHSSFWTDPSGVPSSKYARRYQAPSHASSNIPVSQRAWLRYRCSRSGR